MNLTAVITQLSLIRFKKKITITQMAVDTGISRTTLSRMENGHGDPKTKNIVKVMEYLNCELSIVECNPASYVS